MGLLTLAANQGSILEIEISGDDAENCMKELENFLLNDIDEEKDKPAK
jgi:phosphotransferase system HPr-like phosphotransfer protein